MRGLKPAPAIFCYLQASEQVLSSDDRILQLTVLQLFLAFDAVGSPRQGFQPFRTDLVAALQAIAVIAFAESVCKRQANK